MLSMYRVGVGESTSANIGRLIIRARGNYRVVPDLGLLSTFIVWT